MIRYPYRVKLIEYRLDQGHVGELTGRSVCLSRHTSLKAAGRSFGSVISGKAAKHCQPPRGLAYRYYWVIVNMRNGEEFSRYEAK